jgi:hypothetical protein
MPMAITNLPRPQETGRVEEGDGLSTTEPLHQRQIVQNAGSSNSSTIVRTGPLCSQYRYYQSVPSYSGIFSDATVSHIRLCRPVLPIQGDAVWHQECTQDFHESDGCGDTRNQREIEGDGNSISGRSSFHQQQQGRTSGQDSPNYTLSSTTRMGYQQREIKFHTNSNVCVSGYRVGYTIYATQDRKQEKCSVEKVCYQMDAMGTAGKESSNTTTSQADWTTQSNAGTTPASILIPFEIEQTQDTGSVKQRLEWNTQVDTLGAGGTAVVENAAEK